MNDYPDPLGHLLRPNLPSESPAWKQTLLARTTRTLRWRRRTRQLAFVGTLAASFAAGMMTMRLLQAAPVVEHHNEYVDLPADSGPSAPPNAEPKVELEPTVTALALEWQAVENPERSVELYRRAGDRYFDAENDLGSAVRCYKRFLSDCSESELEITAKDN